jgi:hypothetical protein
MYVVPAEIFSTESARQASSFPERTSSDLDIQTTEIFGSEMYVSQKINLNLKQGFGSALI